MYFVRSILLIFVLIFSISAQAAQVNEVTDSTHDNSNQDAEQKNTIDPSNALEKEIHDLAEEIYVVDYESNMVILMKNAHKQMTPSSMTKIMTLYIIFSLVKSGDLTFETTTEVSENAWRQEGSRMFLNLHSIVTVRELIDGIAVSSGNDATVAAAELISGNVPEFVDLMNKEAKLLGMNNTCFTNPSGLPDKGLHYSTAFDICILSIKTFENFPEYYAEFYGKKEFYHNNIRQFNRNPVLKFGGDGLKTGMTDDGGYGVSFSVHVGDRRIFAVINGCKSEKTREECARKIIDYAFKAFKREVIYEAGKEIAEMEVECGKSNSVKLCSKEPVVVLINRFATNANRKTDDKKSKKYDVEIIPIQNVAPIAKGAEIAHLKIKLPNGSEQIIPLIAMENVDRKNEIAILFEKLFGYVRSLLMG